MGELSTEESILLPKKAGSKETREWSAIYVCIR